MSVQVHSSSETVRSAAVPGQPVSDPAAWTGSQISARHDWMFQLSANEIAGLKSMAAGLRDRLGDNPNALLRTQRENFDLGPFATTLAAVSASLHDGLGLALIRGLPLDELDPMETAIIYWGMGRHMGRAVSNNPEGDMIGHVTDLGKDYDDPRHRGYQTASSMDYHCDQSDIVGLLCLQTSKSGGLSKIASSLAVHNELLRRRPHLADALRKPLCWSKHNEFKPGEAPYYESPVFNFKDGFLSIAFGPKHIEKGHALAEAVDMTPLQREALAVAESICEELHFSQAFQRGDIQFLNNAVAVHTRDAYQDWPEPERKRHLWRLWLVCDDARPQTPYHHQWRNGIHGAGTEERIVLD